MARSREQALVRALSRVFAGPASAAVRVGIGDDAAVLAPARSPRVWTLDVQVEGVHFRRSWLSLAQLGARSLHAAVSDLAAMGARPEAALSGLVVPRELGERDVLALARGQARAARALACPVVGGNLSRGGELSVTTTALGGAARPILRSGARPGDELWLVGDVGLAAAGLRFLSGAGPRGPLPARQRRARARCVAAWREPRARVAEGLALSGRATAAIDVSDGLAGDLGHVAAASGVRAVVVAALLDAALPRELHVAAGMLGASATELALHGGEDYALIAAGPARRRPPFAAVIGRFQRGEGVVLETATARRPLAIGGGFDHFGRGPGR